METIGEFQKQPDILMVPQIGSLQLDIAGLFKDELNEGRWNSGRFEAGIYCQEDARVIWRWCDLAVSQGGDALPPERYKRNCRLVFSAASQLAYQHATPCYLLSGLWVWRTTLPGSETPGKEWLRAGFAYDGIRPATDRPARCSG